MLKPHIKKPYRRHGFSLFTALFAPSVIYGVIYAMRLSYALGKTTVILVPEPSFDSSVKSAL